MRNVSSRSRTIRGVAVGGSGGGEGEDECTGDDNREVDRTRGDAIGDNAGGGGGCNPAQLGIRTISSISNVRASMMCRRDVCCKSKVRVTL